MAEGGDALREIAALDRLERDAGGKVVSTFPYPALEKR
jgi:hypothetical protein